MASASSPTAFLTPLFASYSSEPPHDRPHVTLTFAQSIDAKIGRSSGGQLILSGKESMVMTHWMRTMHDAILIGIGTALNDNPQLNVRYLPPPPSSSASPHHHLPRPIILDTHLRLSTTCKVLKNYQTNVGRRPWVISRIPPPTSEQLQEWTGRKVALEAAGARIIEVDADSHHDRLSVSSLLRALRLNGIRSLMVEGGARVITTFLSENTFAVDRVVITIAPILMGDTGVAYHLQSTLDGEIRQIFQQVHTEKFGQDMVIALSALPEHRVIKSGGIEMPVSCMYR